MPAPSYTSPDYDPNTWKLGYLIAHYGTRADVAPTGNTELYWPPSIHSVLANPPESMTTALLLPIPDAPDITPSQ